jgi:hypothetical protein
MKMAFKNISTVVLVTCSFIAHAQLATFSKYEAGINAGTLIYQGDLTPSAVGSFKTPAFVFGLNGSRYLTNKFAVRLDLNFGKLKGDDAAYDICRHYAEQREHGTAEEDDQTEDNR